MPNPIQNKIQAQSVERYIDYLNVRLQLDGISPGERTKIDAELIELGGQITDYNQNVKIRLVVDNT